MFNFMMEVNWGKPLKLVVTDRGDIQSFSTIESAFYWLRNKWPVEDENRNMAINSIQGAMDCMVPVSLARVAFLEAAQTAGFQPTA